MSKNLTIDEGGESRHFDGVRRLKTKLMGENAGTCYWVPEDETQAWPTFIMSNGMHTAEDEGVYGFSEANVNVYIPSPNPDWKIIIDDIDIPHIIIEDIDIDIDDIDIHIDDIDISIDDIDGTPVVDIEGIDLDGIEIPNIDIHMDDDGLPTSDIDFKTDIHVWTDENDPSKIHIKEEPNGEEIVLDYDDIDGTVTFKDLLDIRYDDTVIGEEQWVIEAHTKIKVDDVDYEAGDEIRSWDKDEIVDFTMKVDREFTVDYPDIDPDFSEDFDIELDLDNMELDMGGLDMDIDLPLLKMPDFDEELPDEIRIMHVPDKTSYQDGEAIDLDGIVVQAYVNGKVWKGLEGKYYNGYVPAHELSASKTGDKIVSEFGEVNEIQEIQGKDICLGSAYNGGTIAYIWGITGIKTNKKATFSMQTFTSYSMIVASDNPDDLAATLTETEKFYDGFPRQSIPSHTGVYYVTFPVYQDEYKSGDVITNQGQIDRELTAKQFTHDGKTVYYNKIHTLDHKYVDFPSPPEITPAYFWAHDEQVAWTLMYGSATGQGNKVTVSWPRPVDGLALTASFQISVEPAEETTPAGN